MTHQSFFTHQSSGIRDPMSNTENIEAKLAAYVDGEVDAADRAEIETYLAANAKHRALLDAMRQDRALLRALPRATATIDVSEILGSQMERAALLGDVDIGVTGENSSSFWRQFGAIAAVILITATLAGVLYMALPSPKARPPQIAIITPDVPAPDPSVKHDEADREESNTARRPVSPSLNDATPQRDRAAALSKNEFANKLTESDAPTSLSPQPSKAVVAPPAIVTSAAPSPTTFASRQLSPAESPTLDDRTKLVSAESNAMDNSADLARANAALSIANGESKLSVNNEATENSQKPIAPAPETVYVVVHAKDITTAKREVTGYFASNQIAFQQPGDLQDAVTAAAIKEVDQANQQALPGMSGAVKAAATQPQAGGAMNATTLPNSAIAINPLPASNPAIHDVNASLTRSSSTDEPALDPAASTQPTAARFDQSSARPVAVVARGMTRRQVAELSSGFSSSVIVEPPRSLLRTAVAINAPQQEAQQSPKDRASLQQLDNGGLALQTNAAVSSATNGTPVPVSQNQQTGSPGADDAAKTHGLKSAALEDRKGAASGGGAATQPASQPTGSPAVAVTAATTQPLDQTAPLRAGETVRVRAKDVALNLEPIDEPAVVDANGNITLPRVGEVAVAGLTPADAASKLPHALADDPVKAELAWSMERVRAEAVILPKAVPSVAPEISPATTSAEDRPIDVVLIFRETPTTQPATVPSTKPVIK